MCPLRLRVSGADPTDFEALPQFTASSGRSSSYLEMSTVTSSSDERFALASNFDSAASHLKLQANPNPNIPNLKSSESNFRYCSKHLFQQWMDQLQTEDTSILTGDILEKMPSPGETTDLPSHWQ